MTRKDLLVTIGIAVASSAVAALVGILYGGTQDAQVAAGASDATTKRVESLRTAIDSRIAQLERDSELRLQAALKQQASQIELERAQAEERARADVQANPGNWIKVKNYSVYDRGFLRSYRQVSSLVLTNTSPYGITDIRGEIRWLAGDGSVVAMVPFELYGAISPGERIYSTDAGTLSNGTIESAADKADIVFTSARVLTK